MARRASSSINPTVILGGAVAIAVAIFAGKSLLGKKSTSFGDIQKLNVEEVLENANQLRGNDYVVEGTIDQKLQWTTDRGQLVSLKVDTPGEDHFIPIEIPPDFDTINIETRQKYAFRVRFRQGGIAVATGINRL